MENDEETRVVFEIAFAIEDPCDAETVVLARELLRFARRLPRESRLFMAELFGSIAITPNGEIADQIETAN